jgi:hypothetical protein
MQKNQPMILIIVGAFILTFGVSMTIINGAGKTSKTEEDHTVICGAGFFYNLDNTSIDNIDSTWEEMEKLAQSCKQARGEVLIGVEQVEMYSIWGKPASYPLYKQAVIIYKDPTLVINYKVSPEAHKQALTEGVLFWDRREE